MAYLPPPPILLGVTETFPNREDRGPGGEDQDGDADPKGQDG